MQKKNTTLKTFIYFIHNFKFGEIHFVFYLFINTVKNPGDFFNRIFPINLEPLAVAQIVIFRIHTDFILCILYRHVHSLAAHKFSSTRKIQMEHYLPKQNYNGLHHIWEQGRPSEQLTTSDTKYRPSP